MPRSCRNPIVPDLNFMASTLFLVVFFFMSAGRVRNFNETTKLQLSLPVARSVNTCVLLDSDVTILTVMIDKNEQLFMNIEIPEKTPQFVSFKSIDGFEDSVIEIKNNNRMAKIALFIYADQQTAMALMQQVFGILQSHNINHFQLVVELQHERDFHRPK